MRSKLICEYGTNWENLDDILYTCEAITDVGGIPKGQLWHTPSFCNKSRSPKTYDTLKKYELQQSWAKKILKEFPDSFFSVFDLKSIKFLEEETNVKAYKIASPDCVYQTLVQTVTATNKSMYVSVGGATLSEIRECVNWMREIDEKYYSRLTLMSCVVDYPCGDAELNYLRDRISGTRLISWGYSSHSLSMAVPAFAVAIGASAVEVHVKNKNYDSPDNNHSLHTWYLKYMISLIEQAEENLGNSERPLPCEVKHLKSGRRKGDGKR